MKIITSILTTIILIFLASCTNKNEETEHKNTSQENAKLIENKILQQDDNTVKSTTVNVKISISKEDQKALTENIKYLFKGDYVGLSDNNGNVIIPAKFDFIACPGDTYLGLVEVCKNGKFGLYSFPEGKEILPSEYDEFYPVYDDNLLAYYKKGNTYGIIKKANSPDNTDFSKYSKSPFANGTVAKWKFDFPNKVFMDKDDEAFYYLPSFMKNFNKELKVISEEFDGDYYPEISLSFLDKMNEHGNDYYFMKTTTYEDGNNSSHKLSVCGTGLCETFYTDDSNENDRVISASQATLEFKILENNIFRVKDPHSINIGKNYPVTSLDKYSYFQIKNNKVAPLKSNRFFAFTQYEKITSDFFKGFFISKPVGENNPLEVYVYKHLSIKDLDVMRNEIFASYGYKFKSQEWLDFFGRFDWYKPQLNNVDDKLNEIEKENIKIILKEKEKMKNNEEKYLQTSKEIINNAG